MEWHLYLLRHGIAADYAEDGSYNDSMRPLTDKGRHRTRLVVRALEKMDGKVDRIFSSPYLRAKQTAEIAADVLGVSAVEESHSLYPGSSPHELETLLRDIRQPGENVMLVGHQPHMSMALAWAISGQNGAMMDMKKAGLANVRFGGNTFRGPGMLEWLLTPKWVSFIFPGEEW